MSFNANRIRAGMVLDIDGEACKVMEATHITPGKGNAVVQTKMRNLKSGIQFEKRFRAVEHAAPLVRATNTGISAFVTASGDVVETLGVGKEGVLVRPVPMVDRGRTLYARYGYRMPWALGAFVLLALLVGPFLPGGNRRTD